MRSSNVKAWMQTLGCAAGLSAEGADVDSEAADVAVVLRPPFGFPKRPVGKHLFIDRNHATERSEKRSQRMPFCTST